MKLVKLKTNQLISNRVHNQIPDEIMDIVEGHLKTNEDHCCQHNREILDEIIADLQQYAATLPSVQDLEICNSL